MARTRKAVRKRPGLRLGRSSVHGNRRMVWVNSGRRGWRPRRKQIVKAGLAKICDDERLKMREEKLEVVEVRGSQMPAWGAYLGRVFARISAVAAALVAACIAWAVVRASADPSATVLCPQLLRGVFMVGIPLAVAVFASTCLGELRVIQDKRRTEVLYERTAQWLPGETTAERDGRRALPCSVTSTDCYPETVPGAVISVRDVFDSSPSLLKMADKDRLVAVGDFTDTELMSMRNHKSRIDPATMKPVAVTLEDRYGATLFQLVEKYGSREVVLAKEQEADIEAREANLAPEIPHETHSFTLDVVRLRKALPRNIAHTGTGAYWTKKTPTLHNDTQSGAPAVQTITLTTGGLGVNAFVGGYVSNITRGEIRAIVSHSASTITLEGSLTNWQGGDDLDVYDAWSIIQAPFSQLLTDQGAASFAASQYIRVFVGTFDENVTPSLLLAPNPYSRLLILEGDPADDRANVVLSPSSGTHALGIVECDQILVRHMTLQGAATTATFESGAGCANAEIRDCDVTSAAVVVLVNGNRGCRAFNSTLTSTGGGIAFSAPTRNAYIRNCEITATAGGQAFVSSYRTQADGCTFSGWTTIYSLTGTRASMVEFRNNTFYDCVQVFHCYGWSTPLIAINNIVKDCGTVFQLDTIDPEEGSTLFGPSIELRNNCYHGNTDLTSNGDTYAELIAFNRVDAAGDLVDIDPLLTNPGAGDFSLTSASPCRNAGHGSGIMTGINRVALGKSHPDIGAWSSGTISAPAQSTITNVVVVDKTVTVTISGDAAPADHHARFATEAGAELDEQQRVGPGDIVFTAPSYGDYTAVSWASNVAGRSEPSAPACIAVLEPAQSIVGPTRRLSNRAQVARAFTDALAKVRNGSYRVHRGPVTWVAFDFDAHPLGATVILAESPLRDSGEATIVLELFAKWRETPVERNAPLNDLTLDDLYEDAKLSVDMVRKQRRRDGEAVIVGAKMAQATVEEAYVQDVIMGIIVTIPIGF